jgi:hypothetical protein
MTLSDFQTTLGSSAPPDGLSAPLTALWHDARGDWEAAHRIAQDIDSADGAWIHAYLHRKEGDEGNAAYWYRRAGKPLPSARLDEEWTAIVLSLLP